MERRESSYTVGGNVNWYSRYGEEYGGSLKKTKKRTTTWPSNPRPGHLPGQNQNSKRYAPQCSVQHCIQWPGHGSNLNVHQQRKDKEDVVHIYTGILFSHKREWNWVIWEDLDGPRDCHTEGSKSEREKQTLYINAYTWNLEKWYRWPLPAKQKEIHRWR